jgi:TetR/AcrR family transcriptional regulator
MSEASDKQQSQPSRRQQILECLARELEIHPGERITTAGLARAVGVTEAALYRHFPSKARMFEGLLEFVEESVFGLINRILEEQTDAAARCERILQVLLGFAERNPGITRILIGDALVGENARLRGRVSQFFDRLETQLKQVLREGEMRGESRQQDIQASANLLLATVEGRLHQYVRSGFSVSPLQYWEQQWSLLRVTLF